MTPILGETKDDVKTTQRTLKVLPEVVIYDVDLTIRLPRAIAATSGMNAMAHAVEALYAKDRNPAISLMAEEGLAALAWALPRIIGDPQGPAARSDALYDAWLCGTYLGLVGTALHHKLSHVLGGAFDLPHAETHTIILPHAVAYNALAAPDAMARVARALGAADPAWAIFELAGRLGAKQALRDIGMLVDGIERAVEMTMAAPTGIPARLTKTSYAICWLALGTALRLGRDLALLLLEKSGKGHIFTFRPLNERRHLSAEADQMLTSRTARTGRRHAASYVVTSRFKLSLATL